MPPLETAWRYQDAVYWPKTGQDEYNNPYRGEPVELQVRWESRVREVLTDEGEKIELIGDIVVDRDLVNGSFLYLGTLADFNGTGSGADLAEIMRIEMFSAIPDIKARHTRRTASLARFRGELPALGP